MYSLLSYIPVLIIFSGFGYLGGFFMPTVQEAAIACFVVAMMTVVSMKNTRVGERILYLILVSPALAIGAAIGFYFK